MPTEGAPAGIDEEARVATTALVRSRNDRILGGVCGGIAAYVGMKPTSARILWLVLGLLPGPMWVLYVVLWLVLPEGHT